MFTFNFKTKCSLLSLLSTCMHALLYKFSLFICQGTRIRLDALVKFNKSMNFTSSYYITLLAHDPAATPLALQKTFPVRVDEFFFGSLDLTVSIARPKRDQNEGDLLFNFLFITSRSTIYNQSHTC